MVSALAFLMTAASPTVAEATEQEVVFLAADNDLRISMRLTAEVDYQESMRVKVAEAVDLVYDLEPTGCTISFVVPLDSLSFGLIPDETVEIQLPISPLGTISVNLLTFITQVPIGLAELDLVLEGEIVATSCSCTDGTMWVVTTASDIQWQEASARTVQFSASPGIETSTLRTTLAYTISVGLKAVVLSADFWVFEATPLSSTSGTPALETTVETYEPASLFALMIGMGVAAVVAVAVITLVFAKRRR